MVSKVKGIDGGLISTMNIGLAGMITCVRLRGINGEQCASIRW